MLKFLSTLFGGVLATVIAESICQHYGITPSVALNDAVRQMRTSVIKTMIVNVIKPSTQPRASVNHATPGVTPTPEITPARPIMPSLEVTVSAAHPSETPIADSAVANTLNPISETIQQTPSPAQFGLSQTSQQPAMSAQFTPSLRPPSLQRRSVQPTTQRRVIQAVAQPQRPAPPARTFANVQTPPAYRQPTSRQNVPKQPPAIQRPSTPRQPAPVNRTPQPRTAAAATQRPH
jgi:hypothetical protein